MSKEHLTEAAKGIANNFCIKMKSRIRPINTENKLASRGKRSRGLGKMVKGNGRYRPPDARGVSHRGEKGQSMKNTVNAIIIVM